MAHTVDGLTVEQIMLHKAYLKGERTVEHRAAHSAYNSAWKHAHRVDNTDIAKKIRNREKEYANNRAGTGLGYRSLWLNNIKLRAKKKGLPFNLTLEDIDFPDTCPV